jgi:hypothetical protein
MKPAKPLFTAIAVLAVVGALVCAMEDVALS